MSGVTYCDFCKAEMELSREFIFQKESLDFIDDEEVLEWIRSDPRYYAGEPLRLCKACYRSFEQNQREQSEEERDAELDRRRCITIVAGAVLAAIAFIFIFPWLARYLRP